MNLSTAKICSSRDAATATLRKIGVTKADYDSFIVRRDGKYYTDTVGAEMHVHAPKSAKASGDGFVDAAATTAVETVKTAAKTKVTREQVAGTETCSDVARRLIREGKSNAEVWEVISVQFSLPSTRRGYPSWYRNELRKNGEKV